MSKEEQGGRVPGLGGASSNVEFTERLERLLGSLSNVARDRPPLLGINSGLAWMRAKDESRRREGGREGWEGGWQPLSAPAGLARSCHSTPLPTG